MKLVSTTFLGIFFIVTSSIAQEKTFQVKDFNKIIISPHVEVNLIADEETSVVIETAKVPMDKINVAVEGKVR